MVYCVEVDENDVPFVQQGKYQLRLDREELDDVYKARAVEELRESPENVANGLNKFRELISGEKGLEVPLDDVEFLTKFLRPCKYYPESAFKLLRKFYKFKLKHPDYTDNLTPHKIRHVFDNEVFEFLPTRSSCGSRIMLINVGTKWNPKEVSLKDMFRSVIVAIEIAMIEPKTQVGGVYVIVNVEGLSLQHIYQFSPGIAKLIIDWVQECTAVRLKGIHIINQPIIFNMLYAIFKPFLGEKLKKRIFFHGTNLKPMVEKISAASLPPHLGGNADIPKVPGSLFSDMLFYFQAEFELVSTYGYRKEEESKNGKN